MKLLGPLLSLFLIVALSISPEARAIPEGQFSQNFQTKVLASIQKNLKISQFTTPDSLHIQFGTWISSPRKGTVILVSGRTECIGTFRELIFDLKERGYSVAVLDHRGQGHSSRLVLDKDVGHIEKFQDYVSDFSLFLEKEVYGKLPTPYFILADSMGAAISTLYLAKNPDAIAAASFAAPMYRVRTNPFPETLAYYLASFLRFIGRGATYAPTTQPYRFEQKFEENTFTHSRVRFAVDIERVQKDPLSAVGGPSVNWVYESMRISDEIAAIPKKLHLPILMFQAGIDYFVNNEAQTNFCTQTANCTSVTFPNAFHSLFVEKDEFRDAVLNQTDHFFQSSIGKKIDSR